MISLIGAMGKNRGLGFGNKLPWYLPDDLKRFKTVTRGHAVIMGRKTYEAIGRPLPDRKNIIITRNLAFQASGCIVVGSLEDVLRAAKEGAAADEEIFIIGGAEIYKLALPYADRMYLTFVDAELPADAFFPEFNEGDWVITQTEEHGIDEKHPHSFAFKVYEKKNQSDTI